MEHLYSEPFFYDVRKKKSKCKRKVKTEKHKSDHLRLAGDGAWQAFGNRKKRKRGFNFLRFPRKNKEKLSQSTFYDSRDANDRESRFMDNLQTVCQKHYKAAKDASKNIYNRLLHHYDFTYSFSTVVYSDRYFIYNLSLETKTMPMKCFISDDIGNDILYKRFTRTYNNYVNVYNLESEQNSNASPTKHYMPIFTSWGIQPYTPLCGMLRDFGDRYLLFFTDRRHYYSSFFDDMQQFYDANRLIHCNYRPAFDMFGCSRELLDYDDFVYSHFKLGEMNQKQMQPLFNFEKRILNYRSSAMGILPFNKFTTYEMNSRKKMFKKNNPYDKLTTYGYTHFVSKFPVPDFALSQDELSMRWRNVVYAENKSYEPNKIYEKLYKPGRHVSISNLASMESEFIDKKTNKTLNKKKLNCDQMQSVHGNDASTLDPNKNNLGQVDFRNELKQSGFQKISAGITDILSVASSERGNLLVMEPLLILQNINEERLKNKTLAAKKAQRFMVYVILGYTIFFIIVSFVAFYVMYFI